ncbi:MAG TPA: SMC-Scp complex subunit ScpB [Firmicutes bacterium]|nr:SMC-Scp complex subunit ScpB [Bacillota bacterium]
MEITKIKSILEAILFAAGRPVSKKEIMLSIEKSEEDIEQIISEMQEEYKKEDRGIELIKLEDSYQLCTKKELHEYIYSVLDKRNKPKLSNASLETLAIIAYNPRITRAEVEAIRGVSADACIYKLLEYGLIEEAGKLVDLPGKPRSYRTTNEFLKMFGYSSLKELPELPKYKLDENKQIVIDEIIENKEDEELIRENNEQTNIESNKENNTNNNEEIIAKSNETSSQEEE